MIDDLLTGAGLTEQESKAYLALLELGSSTVKPIAEKAGLKRTSIYNFIDHLVELGLVTRTVVNHRNHYAASSPRRLLEIQKQRLRDLEESLPVMLAMFDKSPERPRISYFEGPAEVANILKEEAQCRKEALYIWPGREALDAVGGAKVMNRIDAARIDQGVWVRTIRFRQKDIHYGLSRHGTKYLREMRWAAPEIKTSMGMGIYDSGKVGIFSSKRESFGVLIESREFQALMTSMFRFFWAASSPAREGEG